MAVQISICAFAFAFSFCFLLAFFLATGIGSPMLIVFPAPFCSNVMTRVQESSGVCFDRTTLWVHVVVAAALGSGNFMSRQVFSIFGASDNNSGARTGNLSMDMHLHTPSGVCIHGDEVRRSSRSAKSFVMGKA